MGEMRRQYYACQAASCTGGMDFSIRANWVRVFLDTSGPLYLTFQSSWGTTGGFAMTSGDSPQTFTDGIMTAMGWASTTTEMSLRVMALSV